MILVRHTPVPAAEALIDLKESARRKRTQQGLRTSPRKRLCVQNTTSDNVGTTPKHYKASKSLDFSSSRPQDSGSDSNEDDEEALPMRKRHGPVPPAEDYMVASYGGKRQRNDHASLHTVSSKLRNLLKLPKAQRWCYYEWFYSNIDTPIFQGENDFCRCLSEMFPRLKTRQLTRIQWHQIRRLMGRPRRCSSLFFQEERQLLEIKRAKVRAIQQQVHQGVISFDFSMFSDLPDEIPAVLVVGTAVTARVHTVECKGFYMGRIEAMDLEKHQYWVTFDRPGLGKHLVSDTDVRSASSPSVISISALDASQRLHLQQQQEERVFLPTTPPRSVLSSTQSLMSPDAHGDPFLTSSPRGKKGVETNALSSPTLPDHIGGFPVHLLRQVTQLSKLLSHKQEVIQKLSNLNTEAEKKHARQKCLTVDFQQEYASAIIQLDDMNKHLNTRLEGIKQYCLELGYGPDVGHPCLELKDCREHASKIAESANTSLEASGSEVRDSGVLSLVSKLTSLLLMIEVLSGTGDSLELNSLTQAIEEIGSSIRPENAKCFRDNVITPLTLIQSGMNPLGTLHAFSVSRTM
eukprot:Em0004g62a